jgi:hypothetical protein
MHSDVIKEVCPFCDAFLWSECRHLIVNMCFDVPPIWSNGFEVVETILMYLPEYQEDASVFDWRECLYNLSLEKVVEQNQLTELEPIELLPLLDGVEEVTNLRHGDMMNGYFFYACVSDKKRDDWLKEFKILEKRIITRYDEKKWLSNISLLVMEGIEIALSIGQIKISVGEGALLQKPKVFFSGMNFDQIYAQINQLNDIAFQYRDKIDSFCDHRMDNWPEGTFDHDMDLHGLCSEIDTMLRKVHNIVEHKSGKNVLNKTDFQELKDSFFQSHQNLLYLARITQDKLMTHKQSKNSKAQSNEPLNSLEEMVNRVNKVLTASGLTVEEVGPRLTTGQYEVTFIPRKRTSPTPPPEE